MEDEVKKPKSALDQAFDKFQEDTEDCRFIRKEMIEQLRKDLPKAQVCEGDKAMMIQAKMSIVTTLNGLLKDVESAAAGKVKLRLSISEQESAGQYSKSIVNLLKMISVADAPKADGSTVVDDSQIQGDLEKRAAEEKIEITEGEISECSGTAGEAPKGSPEPEQQESSEQE